ncbi:hypothetical protein CYMTET_41105 [Cymbomonas tetramitiformis]|uniref:Uncharacterized protein n=1 Tax=Cymbomonas tetramitiformis TaxID=36881 RepID=A0AAE0C6S5_9CHLO|nr:hypothetical protein CYMTET_41105 [Cymbomonas tetramitiformis]
MVSPSPNSCSALCEEEFLCRCHQNHQGDAQVAYDHCRSELDEQRGPLANVCTSGCQDTSLMAAAAKGDVVCPLAASDDLSPPVVPDFAPPPETFEETLSPSTPSFSPPSQAVQEVSSNTVYCFP